MEENFLFESWNWNCLVGLRLVDDDDDDDDDGVDFLAHSITGYSSWTLK
jgi:hypothetical protein